MNKNSKIYIAGHTGLLGSSILRKLKAESYSNLIFMSHRDMELTDKDYVFDFFLKEKPEYVFLAAGLTGGIVANKTCPADFFHVNIAIQDNVFEAALAFDVKHLVFYGSSCMYPKLSAQPMKEDYLMTGPLEETSEAYAMAKMAGIKACAAYNQQYKARRFIALVPNSMYGPNDDFDLDRSHVLASLMRKFHEAKKNGADSITLWGSGKPYREFVFVDDIAAASIFAANNAERLNNHHYNVGVGCDLSINELACLIANIVGFKGEVLWDTSKPDGAPQKLLDSSKFLALGWRPLVSMKEGIQTMYDWYVKREKKAFADVN